ncbi:unnamed protein product [Polarella glacialis]|uniref:Uncharacterized protein n=1 Tax=Polarella glacialis TaxID=89957 RepID=A0A813HM20_POLGL|nr:unnamed protein product [Polarella glacialis]
MRSLVAAGTGWLSLGSSAEAAGGRLWISTDSAALYGCRCAWALRLMGTAFQDGDRYVDWLLTVSLLLIELLLVMKLPQQETVDLQRLALEQLAGVPPPDAAAIFWGSWLWLWSLWSLLCLCCGRTAIIGHTQVFLGSSAEAAYGCRCAWALRLRGDRLQRRRPLRGLAVDRASAADRAAPGDEAAAAGDRGLELEAGLGQRGGGSGALRLRLLVGGSALRLGTAFNDGDRYVDWLLAGSLLLVELLLVMKLPRQETVGSGWKRGLASAGDCLQRRRPLRGLAAGRVSAADRVGLPQ